MKLVDGEETVLLITGSTPAALTKDRSVAEWLQNEVNHRGGGATYRRALIITDERYFGTPSFHTHPVIAIGGPGTNGVTGFLAQALPMALAREERSFVQMGMDRNGRQAVLWGMDAASTRSAAEGFVMEGLLDALLGRIWMASPGPLA